MQPLTRWVFLLPNVMFERDSIEQKLKSIKWELHPYYGPSYISPVTAEYFEHLIKIARQSQEFTSIELALFEALLINGRRNYKEVKTYKYNEPRYYAQKHIGKKSIREIIFSRDNYSCLKCESRERLSIDHIMPICRGGKNEIENYQTLCVKCNSEKNSKHIDYRKF